MKTRGLFPAFVSLVVVGSFAAGLFEPELRAQGGLPELFSNLRGTGSARDLTPLDTYSRVMTVVRDRFAGEVPSDRVLTYAAIRGMLNTLDDPYTRFLTPSDFNDLKQENQGGFEGIGAELAPSPTDEGFIEIRKPIPDGPAARKGVQRKDLITKIDGKSVKGLSVDQAVKLIRGKSGQPVTLTILRGPERKTLDVTIIRAPVEYRILDYRMEDGKIGYVSLTQFNDLADRKLEAAIKDLETQGMKGLVLDLRGNPGGLLDAAINISSRFVPPGKGVVVIVESGGEKEVRRTTARRYMGGKYPLVVLVNRTSASASEIVAGAVKDHAAGTIIGNTTFGKGLVQTVIELEGGAACLITTAKYLTPNEQDINRSREQRGGVTPHIEVEMTEEDFFKNNDTQLKKALSFLHEKIGHKPGPTTTTANPR